MSAAAQLLLGRSQALGEGRRLLSTGELRAELALLGDFTGAAGLVGAGLMGAELGAAGSLMDALLSQHFIQLQQQQVVTTAATSAVETLEVMVHE